MIRLQKMAADAFQSKGMDDGPDDPESNSSSRPGTAHNDTFKTLQKVRSKWVKPR